MRSGAHYLPLLSRKSFFLSPLPSLSSFACDLYDVFQYVVPFYYLTVSSFKKQDVRLTQAISSCQATTFSNPVYESVYRSDASLGSEVVREREPPRVEFRRSKVDFSNPVYEALLMQNGSRKSGTVFWGSSDSVNGDISGNQDTEC